MRILVTGANGYLGQGITKILVNQGVEVVATDLALDRVDGKAEKKKADLFTVENPYSFYGKPDVVLHLAWLDGFEHYSIRHVTEFPKHYLFLKKLVEAGIQRVCVLGSMHEIGFYEGSIDENTPANPQSLYGIAKNALRQGIAILQKTHSFLMQWIRGFYIVGNMECGSSIFSKLVQAEKRGEKTFPFTMGTNQYDFIDYKEFCRQVCAVALQDQIGGIINCCSGNPMRLGERVEQFLRENHFQIKLQYGAFPDRLYDSKAVWGNNRKILEIMEKSHLKPDR